MHDAAGRGRVIDFILNTGFEGELAMPTTLVAAFGMPFVHRVLARLADGDAVNVPMHRAMIL